MKESTKFEIVLQSPVAFTAKFNKDLHVSGIPKYRITGIAMRREGDGSSIFRFTFLIHPDDMNFKKVRPDELYRFRDHIVSLFAVLAMVPVRLLSHGLFTFHLGNHHYEQTSLGFTKRQGPPAVLESVNPLVTGLFLSERRSVVVYLIWQAINADEPLYRFINIAMCVDIIAAEDTSEPNSVNPICPKCGNILPAIPNSLRNKARFLVEDEQLLNRFIDARNKVFHGSTKLNDDGFRQELGDINLFILVILRNYIGKELGLKPIDKKDLHWSVNNFRMQMSVSYTTPEKSRA